MEKASQEKKVREQGSALDVIKSPVGGEGELNLPRAFCPDLERAATHSGANAVQISDSCPREKKKCEC